MSTLELKHICKIYPNNEKKKHHKQNNLKTTDEGVLAVEDFNLEIKDKEFIVLVGPSGCGKSTTLRMVAGLEEISKGELYIDNKLMNDVEPKDRDIAMVFQSYALYPHMTVRQNMEFPLKLRKMPKDQIKKKVDEAAEILGITEYLDRKPKALSGGQRQRVAIGRAIVREPKVLLMDEPLSNLDAKLRNQMRAEIIKLRSRIDTTFIYVTHDQTEAMTVADRIVVFNKGIVQQFDTPRNLYERPVNKFVAGFIGSPEMNFLPAKIVSEDGKVSVDIADRKFDVSETLNKKHELDSYIGSELTYGVRPEDIILVTNDNVDSLPKETIYKVHVKIAEFLGAEIYLYFDLAGVQCICRTSAKYRVNYGDDIYVSLNPKKAYIFNEESNTIAFPEPSSEIKINLDI